MPDRKISELNPELQKIVKKLYRYSLLSDREMEDYLSNFEKEIIREVLTDICAELYYLPCNQQCDGDKYTVEQVIKEYTEALEEIEERYDFDFVSEVIPHND